jgi:hypothetical protein
MQRKALSPSWENAKQALRGNENWGQPELNAPVTTGAAFQCVLSFLSGRQIVSPGLIRPLDTNGRKARFVGQRQMLPYCLAASNTSRKSALFIWKI